jgi:hypothetical protein
MLLTAGVDVQLAYHNDEAWRDGRVIIEDEHGAEIARSGSFQMMFPDDRQREGEKLATQVVMYYDI